jgi:hypothetical protein
MLGQGEVFFADSCSSLHEDIPDVPDIRSVLWSSRL